MRFEGTAEFVADRSAVFAFLTDPTRMGPCSPAPIERVDATHFRSQAKVGSGFLSAKVTLEMELVEAVADERARLEAHGRGSGTTFTGSTAFELRSGSMDGMTAVDWIVEFELQGMLAAAANRIIADQSESAIARLLDCVRRQLEG